MKKEQSKELERYEKIISYLQDKDISYALWLINIDRDDYICYKAGKVAKPSDSVKVLEILEKLGYSMDEVGTYFYKDLILEVYKKLKEGKSKELEEMLVNHFSQLYYYIASDDKEIGIKSFHSYIRKAIEEIDLSSIDKELKEKIYGDKSVEDYDLNSLNIASYLDSYQLSIKKRKRSSSKK